MEEMHELTPAEKWERATLADNFIFCKVMTANPDLCKELLELLLNIKIERIEIPVAERSFKVDYDSKGIRFDVYVKDGTHKVFFNASKYDKMPTESLREFFKFLNGLNAASDFTDQLEQKVRYAKTNAQWRHRFMTWEQEMRIQVKEKSEQLAKEMAAEKVEETAKKLLAEKIAPEVVAKCTGLSLEQVKKLANG